MLTQFRPSYILYNTVQGAWLNRMADNLTTNMFLAMRFGTEEEATHWLREGIYSPVDHYDFVVMHTITTIQEVENE